MKKAATVIAWVVYAVVGVLMAINFYMGASNFFTTTYLYLTAVLLLILLRKKRMVGSNVAMGLMATVLALFVAEVALRYVFKLHVTYSEQQAGRYVSHYRYDRMINFSFLVMDGRADAHTSEFNPGQKRDYNGDNTHYDPEYTNALGTRGLLPDTAKEVVFVMGDSFAEGVGTPADSTFAVLLQAHLAAQGSDVSVLNLGVAGFDVFITYNFLKKIYPRYHPKEVVLLLNTTDIAEVVSRGGKERFLPNGKVAYPEGPWWEPFYALSYIVRAAVHAFGNYNYHLIAPAAFQKKETAAMHSIVGFINGELAGWCRSNEVKLYLLLHPQEQEIGEESQVYNSLSKNIIETNELRVCNSREAVKKGYELQENIYWQHDRHFSPKGYAILAKFAAENCLR